MKRYLSILLGAVALVVATAAPIEAKDHPRNHPAHYAAPHDQGRHKGHDKAKNHKDKKKHEMKRHARGPKHNVRPVPPPPPARRTPPPPPRYHHGHHPMPPRYDQIYHNYCLAYGMPVLVNGSLVRWSTGSGYVTLDVGVRVDTNGKVHYFTAVGSGN